MNRGQVVLPGTKDVRAGLFRIRDWLASSGATLLPGLAHRRRLASIDQKIVVSGTRGKSSLTRWLYDILYDREQDVYAKITGNKPVSLYQGEAHPIERGDHVRLYENEEELRKYSPDDAMILENQAISSYTNRAVNEFFAQADVVVLTNIREDHLSTLGSDRYQIARSLVRSVPPGTHVVNGERDPALREYIDREVRRRDATVSHVTAPPRYSHIPGIESVYGMNHVLAAIDQPPLPESVLADYRSNMRVEWTRIPRGLVYNAAEVNDVQSTEMIRQSLMQDVESSTVQPFVYLRGDRRGRTASFLRYLESIAEADDAAFETVHVAGEMRDVFKRKASFPVVTHDSDPENAPTVLDELLDYGYPVLLMGNTVATFMRALDDEIERRVHHLESVREQASGADEVDTDSTVATVADSSKPESGSRQPQAVKEDIQSSRLNNPDT